MANRRRSNMNQKHDYINNSRAFENVPTYNNINVNSSTNGTTFNGIGYIKKNNNINKKKTWPFILLALMLIVVSVFIYFYSENNKKLIAQQKVQDEYNALVENVSKFDNVFANGVYVDGIHLGGLSFEEGKKLVEAQSQQKAGSWQINVLYEGKNVFSINNNTIGYQFNSDNALQKAWALAKSGDIYERKAEIERLANTRTDFYSAESEMTLEKIDRALAKIEEYSHIEPVDAKLIGFDASLDYPYVFEREVYGRDIDVDSARKEIMSLLESFSSGNVELKSTKISPSITVNDLSKKYTLLNKSVTEISKRSTDNRTENIRVAFAKYNGMRIKPGRRFSFNSVVGPRTADKGFYEAIEYAYGELVEGYGGGVCQASSTTYMAAIKSGLKINKRVAHSMPVNYAELGQDATVYLSRDRNIDLIFENNTDHDIYIKAEVVKHPKYKKRFNAVVSIYGYKEDDIEYKIESTTLEELDPPLEPKYIDDKYATYVKYTDQQKVVQKSKKGYVVESYLVKYQNGNEIDRKKISKDVYKPQQERVYVGVTPRY